MSLPKLELPNNVNYFGAFLTLGCNYSCSFCINDPEQADRRNVIYPLVSYKKHLGLTPEQWIQGLARFPAKADLPITYCGGEATLYANGDGLAHIISGLSNYADILTNFASLKVFKQLDKKDIKKLQRPAPYPSIRVSYHPDEANRVHKGKGFEDIVNKCEILRELGFDISPDAKQSDVGVYMVAFPTNEAPDENLWKGIFPFETKEYLGVHEGTTYGTYKYPHSIDLVKLGVWPHGLTCRCNTSEIIVDPMGFIWSCHHHMYETWSGKGLVKEFASMLMHEFKFVEYESEIFSGWIKPLGHILDPDLSLGVLKQPTVCHSYGECSPCDTKLKVAHYREDKAYVRDVGYSSVKITDIQWPEELKGA